MSTLPSLNKEKQQQGNQKHLVIVISGPTGVGKSDVAARLCASEKGMVVSADSVQAYRGVHIGANKPSIQERLETPHILVDVANHTENYNAADWRDDALFTIQSLLGQSIDQQEESKILTPTAQQRQQAIVAEIEQARQQKGYQENEPLLPIVCGGTMMYIQWLVHGRPDAMKPTEDATKQANDCITNYQQQEDWEGAVQHASSFGPVFADRVSNFCGEDWYRLRRTLEVAYTVSGGEGDKELSHGELYNGLREGSLSSMGYDVRCFFLCPDDRMKHTEVVDRRCEQMVMAGLLKETTDLYLSNTLPEMATRAIGYRQTLDYLTRDQTLKKGCGDDPEKELFENFLHDFAAATRRYAKKQMSWFRKDQNFMFIPVNLTLSKDDRVDEVATSIQRLCSMSRQDYDTEMSNDSGISVQARNDNEGQGKNMKFYQFKRQILLSGTEEFDTALAEAIACSRHMQTRNE